LREIVIASGNEKKKNELKRLLNLKGIRVLTLKDFKDIPKVNENKKTFEGNAVKKALEVSGYTGKLTVADDSGLEVDVLGGKPGVRSARYAGPEQNDRRNNLKLLKVLNGLPKGKRRAQFRCVIAVAENGKLLGTFEGKCRGYIGFEMKGNTGFGYDCVFTIPKYGKTFAQLGSSVKDGISHRSRAIKKSKKLIQKSL
jgi:XTP/dITP diphosphohydrolase